MTQYLLKTVRIVDADQDFVGDVLIGEGKILEVSKGKEYLTPPRTVIINGKGKLLLPGLIDSHVHFREPGLTHKEDFSSGSRSAIAGGITTFFDMPNTIPPTFTLENLEQKRTFAREKSLAHFGFFFGAGENNLKEIQRVQNISGIKLYLNQTTGNLKLNNELLWQKIFKLGKRVVLHAEGDVFVRAVEIWREAGRPCPLHLAHTSQKKEVELVREMKKRGENISCEVCPHHLLLSQGQTSVKPDIPSFEDQKALWEGIEDRTIDILVTDHAPHTWEEKEKRACGIPGTETLLPLMMTEFEKRNISLSRFVEMTSFHTTKIFNIHDKKGCIEKGYDADMILVDPKRKYTLNPAKFFSKAKWSPFEGYPVHFLVEKTFVSGELVFDEGKFVDENFRGCEIQFDV